jgi:hypothetical protein
VRFCKVIQFFFFFDREGVYVFTFERVRFSYLNL